MRGHPRSTVAMRPRSMPSAQEFEVGRWTVMAPGEEAILTIPAKRPIKPVYIRKLLAMLEGI